MNGQIFTMNGWACRIGLGFQFLGHFLSISEAIYPKWYQYTRTICRLLSSDFFIQIYFADHLTFILRRVIRAYGSNVQDMVCKYLWEFCVYLVFRVVKRKKIKEKGPLGPQKKRKKRKAEALIFSDLAKKIGDFSTASPTVCITATEKTSILAILGRFPGGQSDRRNELITTCKYRYI